MNTPRWLSQISPLTARLATYRPEMLRGDLVAGGIVAIMLVPQAMAYAMLAGLPPEVGLYASILPLVLYGLLGSSSTLAVGPVAMVSLLVVSGVSELAEPGSAEYLQLCWTLALLVGVLQLLMALFRVGFLVNFISHPVLIGFTSAAAIVIGLSQFKHLLGVSIEGGEYPWQLILGTLSAFPQTHMATAAVGLGSCALLWLFRGPVGGWLQRWGLSEAWAETLAKAGPLVAVGAGGLLLFSLDRAGDWGVARVGEIPPGLPHWTLPTPTWSQVGELLPLALVITVVGYLESISVARSLAARRREKVSANRELFALGMADLGAAFTGGYPVTGGFSRSLVNFSAGARTPLASLVTAALVALSVALLTPLFFYIPKAVLAAIIVVAVMGLIDVRTPVRMWKYSRPDAAALGITFFAVLGLGIESGILVGVAATVVLLVARISRPHVAEVGRLGNSEHFRNVRRHDVVTTPGVLALRIDESLNFANAPFLENTLRDAAAERPGLRAVLLIASGINDLDSTGMESLETAIRDLRASGIELYLSDVKGPVTDRLRRAGFDEEFLQTHLFLSAHQAMQHLEAELQVEEPPLHESPGLTGSQRKPSPLGSSP